MWLRKSNWHLLERIADLNLCKAVSAQKNNAFFLEAHGNEILMNCTANLPQSKTFVKRTPWNREALC